MNMRKLFQDGFFLCLYGVFCILFFMLFKERSACRWVSFGFMTFAWVVVFACSYSYRNEKHGLIFWHVSNQLCFGYLGMELVVGMICCLWNGSALNAGLVQGILMLLFFSTHFAVSFANSHTGAINEEDIRNVTRVKNFSSRLRILSEQAPTEETRRLLENYENLIRGNTVDASVSTVEADLKIAENLKAIEKAIASADELGSLVQSGMELVRSREESLGIARFNS